MAKPAPPPFVDPSRTAFFFDFDGTLAAIVDDPQAVQVDTRVLEAVRTLHERAGGALAVVSGRSIEQLDRMLHPLRLPAAGVHGIERRDAAGRFFRVEIDEQALGRVQERIGGFVGRNPGLLAELKPGSVALHYRKRPELGEACRALAAELAEEDDRVRVIPGKMVLEMKLAGHTKGDAIADFMRESPFRNHRPLFAGDDVTDEDGFAVVERLQGISIRIGEPAVTHASHGLADTDAFREWLVAVSRGGSS